MDAIIEMALVSSLHVLDHTAFLRTGLHRPNSVSIVHEPGVLSNGVE